MAVMLEFEKPIVELEKKIAELEKFTQKENIDLTGEIVKLTERLDHLRKEIFENLTSWQKVQLARHPNRPYTMDYIGMIMEDYMPIYGDRHFGDDKALITGLARIDGQKLMVIGHQKGRDINENLERNFGCAHPEGYRKAMRMMRMAEKYQVPIVTFIDTPGASAAMALKLTAPELMELGIIDGMIPEPLGGAHRKPEDTAQEIKTVIQRELSSLLQLSAEELVDQRYNKYRKIGVYREQ